MKINIVLQANADDVALQMFDAWYAYLQSQSNQPGMKIDVEIVQNDFLLPSHTNILLATMPDMLPNNVDEFDLIFFANMFEPCSMATDIIFNNLNRDNAYFLNGSTLVEWHPWKDKLINPHCNIGWLKEFFTRFFYPSHYNILMNKGIKHRQGIVFINGANRAHRHYFHQLLQNTGSKITLRSSLGDNVLRTDDAFFESQQDIDFRLFVNNFYEKEISNNTDADYKYKYHDQAMQVGINGKFGRVISGMFILPEYWQSDCVIFPESSWINDTLHITEKSVKCFFAGCFPWPIAGSNTNSLYNSLGFYTAWNLLPDNLQEFDSIKDHRLRYTMQVKCLEWASRNLHIFSTDRAKEMLLANYLNLHCFRPILDGMNLLTNIITKHERRH